MQRGFWIALVLIVAAFVGLFALTGNKQDAGPNSYSYTDAFAIQPNDHKVGTGKVVLIEYGDLQCPACRQDFPALQQLKSSMGDKMTFVYRHFPIPSNHPNAMAAHRAAVAASKQNKFFEMHDLLYSYQDQWATASNAASIFETYAQQLQLNMDQFRTDVASADTLARINADLDSAARVGVNSTPTYFLNGQKLEERPRDFAGWQELITKAATQ